MLPCPPSPGQGRGVLNVPCACDGHSMLFACDSRCWPTAIRPGGVDHLQGGVPAAGGGQENLNRTFKCGLKSPPRCWGHAHLTAISEHGHACRARPPSRIKSLFFIETELVKCDIDIVRDRTSGSCRDPEILKTGPEDVCDKEGG